MMYWYGGGKNLNGGVFRRETVQPCHTYRFTMYARSGLEAQHPPTTNARMQVGISPTGDYPDQVVLTPDRIAAITWSAPSNSQYAYVNQSVQAEAQGNTMTVFTRADTDPNNEPYIYWDEGSFTEVTRQGNLIDASQPLPASTGGIYNVQAAVINSQSAQVSWNTGSSSMLGQVLYRPVGSTQTISPTDTMTYHVHLPFVVGGVVSDWQYSPVDAWGTAHAITLASLQPSTMYEYIVVAYGYTGGACGTLVSETSEPRKFQTP